MHPMLTVRQYGAMALRTSYADDPSDAQPLNSEWSDVIRHRRRPSCICYFLTAPKIEIYDSADRKYTAVKVAALDPSHHIAPLKVDHADARPYLPLVDAEPKQYESFDVIGHPNGIRCQSFQAKATYPGFVSSRRFSDSGGNPIFSRDIELIALDQTIYGGMSGAPVINQQRRVVAVLSGSLNVGGALAWGIPAARVIALRGAVRDRAPVDVRNVQWPRVDIMTRFWRGFSRPLDATIGDTLEYLNEKWRTAGVTESSVEGFPAKIERPILEYSAAEERLSIIAV